jgi:hypothetical protein
VVSIVQGWEAGICTRGFPMAGRSFGYARVFTDDQNLDLQLDALTRHGIPASHIFKDKLSGAKCDRPGLDKCLSVLRTGDVLVVWRLDRLGRSVRHLITLVEDLREKGIGFRSLQKGRSIRRRRRVNWSSTSSRRWRSLSVASSRNAPRPGWPSQEHADDGADDRASSCCKPRSWPSGNLPATRRSPLTTSAAR